MSAKKQAKPTQAEIESVASALRSHELFGYSTSFRGEWPRRSLTYDDSISLAEKAIMVRDIQLEGK